ncbi:hypothetical protein [Flagellimonas halotolerans]|uniref:Uncharacterized protein n=1 Tax=Flagellimonas halotolerans TaxID=3112164 RepID=A0ABU6ITH4_9FLAO|nr:MULTISPECIES: hypothetical protein [unclassified Allomuricauda]MEC3966300.1 hypothetical protein [Muricauda sp. SYSU M86414]MEC4266165.1 hypothetical protein [Muricauda sp. SYSU M84420]
MKKFITPLLLFLTGNLMSGQYAGQVASGSSYNAASNALVSTVIGDMDDQYDRLSKQTGIDDFSGSPYMNDTFVPTPLFYGDEGMGTYYYRYNAYNEEIEIKKTNLLEEQIAALTKDKSIKVMVKGKPMGFATFIDKKGNTLNGYLTTVLDGKTYDLYKRINVKFTEGQKAQNSFVKAVPNRFTHFIEYYYQEKGVNRIDEIPLKTNKVAKLFKEPLRSEVKNYIKDNNLDVKEESDLIKVFNYLNER